jgi:glycolate oxidase
VPRTRLPAILAQVIEIGRRYDLPIANLFHAGDGNLHPMILFDVREAGILDRVMAAGREILGRCIDAGGTITGEHGVGMEKQAYMPLIFSADDLDVMRRVRVAFDPSGRLNPSKVLPTPGSDARAVSGRVAPTRIPEGMWV